MNDLSRFNEKTDTLLEMEVSWRKQYRHRKPCKDWLEHERIYGYGFCRHYALARRRHFKKEIDALWDFNEWDGKLYNWAYISNK